MANLVIRDINVANLFGDGDEPNAYTVVIYDWSYDSRDHRGAVRAKALRLCGGKSARIVRAWHEYDYPAFSVLVTGATRDPWDAFEARYGHPLGVIV